MSFETLGLGPNLLRSIGEVGYAEPTPIQQAAIPLIIDGKDLIGICLLYTSPSPRDLSTSRMPSSA